MPTQPNGCLEESTIMSHCGNCFFCIKIALSGFAMCCLTDTKGIFSVSPEECDILPLKTASFRVTFRPVSVNYQ